MGTHVAQKAPSESMGEAHDYMEVTRPKMLEPCRHQDYVLNMDQTPVPFSYVDFRIDWQENCTCMEIHM